MPQILFACQVTQDRPHGKTVINKQSSRGRRAGPQGPDWTGAPCDAHSVMGEAGWQPVLM